MMNNNKGMTTYKSPHMAKWNYHDVEKSHNTSLPQQIKLQMSQSIHELLGVQLDKISFMFAH